MIVAALVIGRTEDTEKDLELVEKAIMDDNIAMQDTNLSMRFRRCERPMKSPYGKRLPITIIALLKQYYILKWKLQICW